MQINHKVQLLVLRELLFKQKARFAKLNILGLDNNYFNFHLKQIINHDLVEKLVLVQNT